MTQVPNAVAQIGFIAPPGVRVEGSNAGAGRKILKDAAGKLPTLQAATDLGDAAKKVTTAMG